jgi:hypothetical protein
MAGNYFSDDKVFPWAYFLAVAAAELMIAFDKAFAGLILYFILLAVVFIQSIRSYPYIQVNAAQDAVDATLGRVLPDSRTRFYLALMLVYMIRVVGLPLFLVDFSMAYRLILVGLPLFTAAFLIIRFAGYNVQDIYLTISFPDHSSSKKHRGALNHSLFPVPLFLSKPSGSLKETYCCNL